MRRVRVSEVSPNLASIHCSWTHTYTHTMDTTEDQIDYEEYPQEGEEEYAEGAEEEQRADSAEDMLKRMAEMDEELKQTEGDVIDGSEQAATQEEQMLLDEKSMYVSLCVCRCRLFSLCVAQICRPGGLRSLAGRAAGSLCALRRSR